MFLTNEELELLTGYSQSSKQKEFLLQKRIPHEINGRGQVVVARYWVERYKFEGPFQFEHSPRKQDSRGPDLSAFGRRGNSP